MPACANNLLCPAPPELRWQSGRLLTDRSLVRSQVVASFNFPKKKCKSRSIESRTNPEKPKSKRATYQSQPLKKPKKKKSKKIAFFRIEKTRAESHAIDATRHLYTLQYPVWNLSRLQMIHGSSNLALLCAPRKCVWSWPEGYRNFNR